VPDYPGCPGKKAVKPMFLSFYLLMMFHHHHHDFFTALFSGTTQVSQCQKRTYVLYGARGD